MEHNTPKILTRRTRSAACLIVFVSACRFSSAPTEALDGDAIESSADVAGSAASSGDAGARPATTQMVAAAQGSNAAALDASAAAQSGPSAARGASGATQGSSAASQGNSAVAGSGSPASNPITAHAPPPTAAKPAADSGGAAMQDLDAGSSQPSPDGTTPPSDSECSQDLANCLLEDPLSYAKCLRINADHGCPEPDAGITTTSPVTTQDGKPLSQACQAELANCIARNPTPQNAGECTEKAQKCK